MVLPGLLLSLDVLEGIHPFALHVASRGGGELPVPEKCWMQMRRRKREKYVPGYATREGLNC